MSRDQDVNFRFQAEGVDQTVQATEQVNESLGKTGDTAQKSGTDAADGLAKQDQAAKKSTNALDDLLTRYVSIAAAVAAVTKAINAQSQAMEENARVAAEQQNALLRLQFLGDYYKEKPELRKEIMEMAEFGRRPFEEVAGAAYNLRSKNAAMTEQQRMGIMMEALEMGRTDPSLPLDTLVDMFSLYSKQSGVADANRIQNVLQQTIAEAGGSAADVATYMPRFLPIGMAGGLSASEAAGLWAYATTQEAEASIATTGLRAIMMGLQGKGTPEGAKLLEQMGITQDMGFFKKLDVLASQDIDLPTAELLFQREGAAMGLNILKDPSALMRAVRNVTAVDRGDIDLTRSKLEGLFSTDETAKREEDSRRLDTNIQNIKASDDRAQRNKLALKEREAMWRKTGLPEYVIRTNLWLAEQMMGFGASPEQIFSSPIEHWMLERDDLSTEVGAYTDEIAGRSDQRSDVDGEASPSPGPTIINNHYDMSRTIQTKDPGSTPRTGEL